jgi:signal transduction histidine kinase/CheY-like chemotaxis protein
VSIFQPAESATIKSRIRAEQLHAHYESLLGLALAPGLIAMFIAWMLWGVVANLFIVGGLASVFAVSLARLFLRRAFLAASEEDRTRPVWVWATILSSLVLGSTWGAAAFYLYPSADPQYDVLLLVFFALIPIVPLGAMALYLPAFLFYSVPCTIPFVVRLALTGGLPETMTAILVTILAAASIGFAYSYQERLLESMRLRVRVEMQRDEVARAVDSKSRFLAAASHDLRQPLHALGLLLASLRVHAGTERGDGIQDQAEDAVDTLRGLLDSLLDISRLDAGVVQVNERAFELDYFLEKHVEEYTLPAQEKGIELDWRRTHAAVRSDPVLLSRLMRNLLDNAVKYTEHGSIEVWASVGEDTVTVHVSDTGMGIDPENHGHVFEEFAQLRNPARDRAKGLGLGLAIVARVGDLLGCPVRLESELGRGSTFSFDLTRAMASEVETGLASSPTRPALDQLDGRRVLIIDDDIAVLRAMDEIMAAWGCEVSTALSGQEAHDRCSEGGPGPELIIADFSLSDGESGIDVVRELREKLDRRVPAILITGDTSAERLQEAEQAGLPILHKPTQPGKLRALSSWAIASGETEGDEAPVDGA